ncbi:HypC/HybG/HupF family hydrogenase formation chaperone [Paramagnetospirillum kuznetsovii]|uniref:HypC/HybG/HupF family hydrogenase formation chaperone n=1 Tax=Paramagnetospirillum kuznetsovii TaxID=2053833 RepID=A0A364NUB6_9PROT|nr:HypC/HybG/HupF family hydrogenase formation chaperone [Paramagnetospirillum kuznetsovii]RAU20664.1 HypC/HybG/HupF family hydrogenase formation chaperone [Paramagnetospirillum kuznetsovii]
MCMAVPSRIVSMANGMATVEAFGTTRTTSLMLLEDEVAVGDYVILGVGGNFAAEKLAPELAAEALAYLAEVLDSGQA